MDPKAYFPRDTYGDVEELTPLTMGMSGSAVWAVKTAKGRYVLRHHRGDRNSWQRAITTQRLASDAGAAPKLVKVDDEAQVAIAEQIVGTHIGVPMGDPATRDAAIGSLVAQLRAMHEVPLAALDGLRHTTPGFAAGANADVIPMVRGVWAEQVKRPGFPAWVKSYADRIDRAEAALAADPRRVFGHNDLNPGNVLWDGKKAWLVDWDGAGPAHPYMDVAGFSCFANLPDEAAAGLAGAVQGAPLSAEQLATLRALRDVVRVGCGCIFLRLVPDLTAVELPASRDDAKPLPEVYRTVFSGQVALGSPQGQSLMAAALLKQVPV